MADEDHESTVGRYKTTCGVAFFLILLSIVTRSATSILTPIWLDARKNTTNVTDQCDANYTQWQDTQVDALAIMCIVNFIFFIFWGFIVLVMSCFCPSSISKEQRKYDKREFAVIGFSDAVSGILFVFASSGCRTAPYMQSIAANFCVPVTFMIR